MRTEVKSQGFAGLDPTGHTRLTCKGLDILPTIWQEVVTFISPCRVFSTRVKCVADQHPFQELIKAWYLEAKSGGQC